MIHELCLVQPDELIPFPASYEYESSKPWIELLFVNKQISEEAAQVFYGKNTWRISDSAAKTRSHKKGPKSRPLLWETHLHSMRHITIVLDSRAVEPAEVEKVTKNHFTDAELSLVARKYDPDSFTDSVYSDTDNEEESEIKKSRYTHYHKELTGLLRQQWGKKLRTLEELDDLKSLEVDLTNIFCPRIHCRPIKIVCGLLEKYVPYPNDFLGWYVTLTGMEAGKEAKKAHDRMFLCEYCTLGEDEDGRRWPHCWRQNGDVESDEYVEESDVEESDGDAEESDSD